MATKPKNEQTQGEQQSQAQPGQGETAQGEQQSQAQPGQGETARPAQTAPAVPGILDELAAADTAIVRAQSGEAQRHTLGAWARAKGVKHDQLRKAIKAGRVDVSGGGDGPVMTEAEFDAAVGFEYRNSFGVLPTVRRHITADEAKGGSIDLEGEAAAALRQAEDDEERARAQAGGAAANRST